MVATPNLWIDDALSLAEAPPSKRRRIDADHPDEATLQDEELQQLDCLSSSIVDEEQPCISTLYDTEGGLLGTLELSFMDDEDSVFSFLGQLLPNELFVREMHHVSVWHTLKTDPSVPCCIARLLDADGAGTGFRSLMWQCRKSAVIDLPNGWEMHLVAETDADQSFTGYLCPSHLPHLLAQQTLNQLLETRKLAAAVDIDDTLVRSIPIEDIGKYPPSRVHVLENIPIVVATATDVHYFLQQASKRYKLSLYSLGMADYVKEVAELLDSEHSIFDWDSIMAGISSARHEHDFGKEASPKKLERVFSFCNQEDGEVDYSMCIAVDDNPKAWAKECRKKVLRVVSGTDEEGKWDANLCEVLDRMKRVHRKYYNHVKNVDQEEKETLSGFGCEEEISSS